MKKITFQTGIGILLVFCLAFTTAPAQALGLHTAALDTGGLYTVTYETDAKSGIPGSVVTYTVTIANASGDDLNVSVDTPNSANSWTPAPSIDNPAFTIPDGGSDSFKVYVPVPGSATAGQNDFESVAFTLSGIGLSADASLSKTFTTTAKAPAVSGRPVILITAYWVNNGKIGAGEEFQLAAKLENTGGGNASNIIIAYDGGTSFFPKGSGGIDSVSGISAGGKTTVDQSFTGADELAYADMATIKATISYTDSTGTAYSDVFSLTFDVSSSSSSGSYATATPAASNQPQLVVTGYKIDVDLLQPGTTFNLTLDVKNMGKTDAAAVTMIMGGGGSSSNNDSGTPQPGGVSGSGSDLTNFAPLNSSNLVYIGDVKKDGTVSLSQKLIVNVTTEPGVYTLKLSFVYIDAKGNKIVDDQVITLLVYSLPKVEVNFYRDPGMFFQGTSSVLPIQVTNLGKKTSVLGNMTVTADGEVIANNVSLVGALDPGGYYTLDANLTPSKEGPMDIVVTINYNDDFNQPRTVVEKISINVQAAMVTTPETGAVDANGNPISTIPDIQTPETFGQKILRFFKGLLGLDSGVKQEQTTPLDSGSSSAPVMVGPKG